MNKQKIVSLKEDIQNREWRLSKGEERLWGGFHFSIGRCPCHGAPSPPFLLLHRITMRIIC